MKTLKSEAIDMLQTMLKDEVWAAMVLAEVPEQQVIEVIKEVGTHHQDRFNLTIAACAAAGYLRLIGLIIKGGYYTEGFFSENIDAVVDALRIADPQFSQADWDELAWVFDWLLDKQEEVEVYKETQAQYTGEQQ